MGLHLGHHGHGNSFTRFDELGKGAYRLVQIFALTAQSFMTVSAVYGIGNHESVLSQSDIVKANLWSWVAQIVAILTLVVARIAVISLLLAIQKRMSQRTYRFGRRLIYFVGALQGVINVTEVILILQQCDPVQKLWNPTVPGTCSLIKICSQVGYLQGTIGVFADLVLAFYPIYIFTRLHQETRVRIGLCLIMGGGVMYEAFPPSPGFLPARLTCAAPPLRESVRPSPSVRLRTRPTLLTRSTN